MARRAFQDPFGSPTQLVDRLIGESYTTVKGVYDKLTELSALYADLTNLLTISTAEPAITNVSGSLTEIAAVDASLTEITAVYASLTEILAVNTNQANIDTVVGNIASVNTLNTNILALLDLHTNLAAILAAPGDATTARDAAVTAQGLAETAQTAAETAQGLAETALADTITARNAAQAALADFYTWFIGAAAADPVTDLNGNPVSIGQTYYNTVSKQMLAYDGAAWVATYLPAATYALLTGAIFSGKVEVSSASPQFKLSETDSGTNAQFLVTGGNTLIYAGATGDGVAGADGGGLFLSAWNNGNLGTLAARFNGAWNDILWNGYAGNISFSGTLELKSAYPALYLRETDGSYGARAFFNSNVYALAVEDNTGAYIYNAYAALFGASGATRHSFYLNTSVAFEITPAGANLYGNGLVDVAAINGGPIGGFRNKLINGEFGIAQRGDSGSGLSGFVYTIDRWAMANTGGITSGYTRNATAAASVGLFGRYYGAFTFTGTGAAGSYVHQKIEDVKTAAGKQITVSGYIGSNTARSITLFVRQNFGTGGSAYTEQSVSLSAPAGLQSTGYFSEVFTLGDMSGKTIGDGSNLLIGFQTQDANTATIYLAKISVVEGDATSEADPFEQRPDGVELALCQRYYQKSYPQGTAPGTATTTGCVPMLQHTASANLFDMQTPFNTVMRGTPTIAWYSTSTGASGKIRDDTGAADLTLSATNATSDRYTGFPSVGSTPAAGNILYAQYTADAEL